MPAQPVPVYTPPGAPTPPTTPVSSASPPWAVLGEGLKATYSAGINGLAAVSGDVFVLTGSATKTIRVTRVQVSGAATAATDIDVVLMKRHAADTGGTSTVPVAVPFDTNDAAATATVAAYTVAPTVNDGTSRPLTARKVTVPSIATPAVSGAGHTFEFGTRNERCPVLRGVAQQLAVNIPAAPAGGSFDVDVTWTEE